MSLRFGELHWLPILFRKKAAIASWSAPDDGSIYAKISIDYTKLGQYITQQREKTKEKITVTHAVGIFHYFNVFRESCRHCFVKSTWIKWANCDGPIFTQQNCRYVIPCICWRRKEFSSGQINGSWQVILTILANLSERVFLRLRKISKKRPNPSELEKMMISNEICNSSIRSQRFFCDQSPNLLDLFVQICQLELKLLDWNQDLLGHA